jgi:uncharacterized protein (DUF1330 family)
MADMAIRFEDEVLRLLETHGAHLLFRGRRTVDQDESLPLEIQLLSFPHREALDAFLADERRQKLLSEFGDVFTRKQTVEITAID